MREWHDHTHAERAAVLAGLPRRWADELEAWLDHGAWPDEIVLRALIRDSATLLLASELGHTRDRDELWDVRRHVLRLEAVLSDHAPALSWGSREAENAWPRLLARWRAVVSGSVP